MSLTTMQELFVRALLADPRRNGTAAAVAAGYSPRRAKKTAGLVDEAEVQLALHAKRLAALEGVPLDLTYVLTGIRNTVERCRGQGKVFNPVSALAEWEEEAQLPQQNSEQWKMNRSRCRLLPVQRSQIELIYGQEAFKNNLANLQFTLIRKLAPYRWAPLGFVEHVFLSGTGELVNSASPRPGQRQLPAHIGAHLGNPATRHTPPPLTQSHPATNEGTT